MYKIVECVVIDEVGEAGRPYYIIKYKVSVLGGLLEWWKTLTQTEMGGMCDVVEAPIRFDSLEEARKVAVRLKAGIKFDSVMRRVVEEG